MKAQMLNMRQVNNLSRSTDQTEGVKKDNENQVMLKKEWLEIRVMEKGQLLVERVKKEIIEKINKSKAKNDEIVKAVEEMKKMEVKMLRNDEWQTENELVLKKRKIYVPKNESLRLEIIQLHHDTLIAGHERQ